MVTLEERDAHARAGPKDASRPSSAQESRTESLSQLSEF
jgi:hypothetical protein